MAGKNKTYKDYPMARKKAEQRELLVALLPRKTGLKTLKKEGWYHTPVDTARSR